MLVAITERYTSTQLQSSLTESQQRLAQEKFEVLSVVAAQMTQRDSEIEKIKR